MLFWVLGKLWSILLPIVLGPADRHGAVAGHPVPAQAPAGRRRWPPSTVLLAASRAFGGIIAAIAPSVANQVTELADAATAALQDVQEWLQGPPFNFGEDQIGNAVDSVINSIQDNAQNIAGYALTGVSAVGNSLLNLVLALVLVLLLPQGRARAGCRGCPRRPARGPPGTWRRCPTSPGTTLSEFIRQQALVGFIDAFFIGLGLWILGVPAGAPAGGADVLRRVHPDHRCRSWPAPSPSSSRWSATASPRR